MLDANPHETIGELIARLRPFVARRVDSAADVDDVLQDVLVRMHERVHALRNREVLGAWLYWVVRNVIADRYRARRRLGEPPNEDDLVADNDGMPRDVKAELAVCVAPFVARLPSPYREAVTVVDIEGLSLKEAAAMVGISTTAMKSRVQRGRARLREIFARRAAARRRLSLQAGTGPLRRRLSSIAQVTPRS